VLPATTTTPLEELRQLAKKRRTVDATNDGGTTLPKRNTKVKFVLTNNLEVSRPYDHDDLCNAWMSRAEATVVKLGAHVTINNFREGTLDFNTECIRGLEVHTQAARMEKRLARSQTYTRRIIEQQQLLRAVMGKVNDQILAKLSHTLSAQDVLDAREIGKRDATTALYIHACDEALRLQSSMTDPSTSTSGSTVKQFSPELPLQVENNGLVTLLQHSVLRSP
jgi:hypothetical protein